MSLPIRSRIELPPKPSFKKRRYRKGVPPRKAVPDAPVGQRILLRQQDIREILRERERPARALLRSPWRWAVVVGTLAHLVAAPVLGGGFDFFHAATAGLAIAVLSPLACFSPAPARRLTFSALTAIGVVVYAIGVGCAALAGTWIAFCVGLAFFRLRALDRELERDEESEEGAESAASEILRRRLQAETETGGTTPPSEA